MDFRPTKLIIFFVTVFIVKIVIADPIREDNPGFKMHKKQYVDSKKLGEY